MVYPRNRAARLLSSNLFRSFIGSRISIIQWHDATRVVSRQTPIRSPLRSAMGEWRIVMVQMDEHQTR